MRIDLHTHSCHSDGTLTPTELVARAHARGVGLLALTDHDELGGLAEASQAARACGLAFLTGVEISVTFARETVHLVGLGIDAASEGLVQGLAALRAGRHTRAQAMAAGLEAAGRVGAMEGARRYVRNPELVSRTHFARWLVDSGACPDLNTVFRHFLVEGKPGHVDHPWATLREAVGWIVGAGGVAVLAHPGRYRYNAQAEWALFESFRAYGGQAVEVVSSSHAPPARIKYADMARRLGLLSSIGTDFHDPEESRLDLGQLPDLPRGLAPVWEALSERILWPDRRTALAA